MRVRRNGRPSSGVIAVVGAGHVGLVYAVGFAELGHDVRVVDVDPRRVAALRRGKVPFLEPDVPELLKRHTKTGRLVFTTTHGEALRAADFAFVCVQTPTTADGSLDDSHVRSALDHVRTSQATSALVVVNKSTVPVGTGDRVEKMFEGTGMHLVSNPEFLSQGRAVQDFFRPSRIVIGYGDRAAGEKVAALYRTLGAPVVWTDHVTAELSKLAANAFLATKISFANAVSQIGQAVGADGVGLTRVLSLDSRIGAGHLRPGLGFGGPCLPKDLAAIEALARRLAVPHELFAAAAAINRAQPARVADILVAHLGDLSGKRVAILGAAYKANTGDTRGSPAIVAATLLRQRGADVVVFDPVASLPRSASVVDGAPLRGARSALAAVRQAEAAVIATDWPEFASLDLVRLRRAMRGDLLVDGRGMIDAAAAARAGFRFISLDGTGVKA